MAGRTTAYVLVGEYAVGPIAEREWKARHGIALIEKHRLVWMPAPVAHGQGVPMPVEPIYLPNGLSPAEELTVLLASVVLQDQAVMHKLAAEGFTRAVDLPDRHYDAWPYFRDEQLASGVDWPAPNHSLVEVAIVKPRQSSLESGESCVSTLMMSSAIC